MKKNGKGYFIHLDADEYINLNDNYENIKDLLKNYNVDILALNTLLYGSNNKNKSFSFFGLDSICFTIFLKTLGGMHDNCLYEIPDLIV